MKNIDLKVKGNSDPRYGEVSVDDINSVINETKNAITKTGKTLDATDNKQLYKAINKVVKSDLCTDSGTVNNIILTRPGITEQINVLKDGMVFLFKCKLANTLATVNVTVDNSPAVPLKNSDGTTLKVPAIKVDDLYFIVYRNDGTNPAYFELVSLSGPGGYDKSGTSDPEIVDSTGNIIVENDNTTYLNEVTKESFIYKSDGDFSRWIGNKSTVRCKSTLNKLDIFDNGKCFALYRLNGNTDDAGGVYNGAWIGSPNYDNGGKFGEAARTSSGNCITLAANDMSSAKAVSLWFRRETFKTGWDILLGSRYLTSATNRLDNIKLAVFGHRFSTYHNDSVQQVSTDVVLQGIDYHVIVMQNSNNNYDYYLNGKAIALNLPDNNALIDIKYIGADNNSGLPDTTEYFSGLICQVRFFNDTLTQEEITHLADEK